MSEMPTYTNEEPKKPVNPLRRALRDEMFAVLNQGELTPAMCSTLMRLAESSREILRAGTMKPEDFKDVTEHVGDQEAQPINTETFGVKMVKELMPILQAKFNPKPQVDTAQLVIALAEARKHGLKDVAESLEIQLGVRTSAQPIGTFEPAARSVLPGLPDHRGSVVDTTNHCDARDCWCWFAVNPLDSPMGATIRAIGVVEAEQAPEKLPEAAP